jgi:hypothetical protein
LFTGRRRRHPGGWIAELNKITIYLPTSQAIGNYIDLGVKCYRIVNSFKKFNIGKFKNQKLMASHDIPRPIHWYHALSGRSIWPVGPFYKWTLIEFKGEISMKKENR